MWWCPTACALQLCFALPPGTGPILPGGTYTGCSTITYRRVPLADANDIHADTGSAGDTAVSEYERFMDHQRELGASGGLHLHAATHTLPSAQPSGAALQPLTVLSYRVSSTRPKAALKVTAVVEEDRSLYDTSRSAASAGPLKGKGKKEKTKKPSAPPAASAEGQPCAAASLAETDIGSKVVLFEGCDDTHQFPLGAEVELTVRFTGTVQGAHDGAIYAAATASGADAPPAVLLTHFEVALARWAFPCPDHPQYRLDWTLQSLQLPACYAGAVFTNSSEVSRRAVGKDSELSNSAGARGDVQLSFGTVGPLPAYVVAFAAFQQSRGATRDGSGADSPLVTLSDVVQTHAATHYLSSEEAVALGLDGTESPEDDSSQHHQQLQISVHCRKASGITEATLARSLATLRETVERLTDFFQCPLPLCVADEAQPAHLVLLLVPTMPYISGMEHHGCIFLNESIFTSGSPSSPSASAAAHGNGGKDKGTDDAATAAQTELIVHEVAHHWLGNCIGFPFAVKEGLCQVLEQRFGDLIRGRPPRKLHAIAASAETPTMQKTAASPSAAAEQGVRETVKGREFTGHSYQSALAEVQTRITEIGFDEFQAKMRALVHDLVVRVLASEGMHGGRQAMLVAGMADEVQPAPYLSAEAFAALLQA